MSDTTSLRMLALNVFVGALILPQIITGAKRNVLLVLGDDAGFQMGAYNNTACKTPNFDKLAARSVVFKHGYTSVSSCSPSRAVLLTGLPEHQNGMYGIHSAWHHFNSFDNVRSLPVILDDAGIRTGIVGKKHIGPDAVYKFDYEETEEQHDANQIGRNITYMKNYIEEFINDNDTRPFFLYIGFHDPHRCNQIPKYGEFCEKFGNGEPGMGVISDWTPVKYGPSDVMVPYFLPDTPATRQDLADMYTTFSRMDQGIGLFLSLLEAAGHMDDTLILFSSDNGIPFPGAKTNLYDPGMGEPMMISSPLHRGSWGKVTESMGSLMDFTPTILDWFNVSYPQYKIFTDVVELTGKSLLPVLSNPSNLTNDHVFSSHTLHGVHQHYPMRVLRTSKYKLIHNIFPNTPYPIATDIYFSPTFLDLLNRSRSNVDPWVWFKSMSEYYYRSEWELYDIRADFKERINLAFDSAHQTVLESLQKQLYAWLWETDDPWVCLPRAVVSEKHCYPLDNEREADMINRYRYRDKSHK
ncbi:N-sulphoglucosamine sulphohydrolase-like [Haliotis rufescens]|uniref:N-sulphoglucosamine sulphohydrolase-like n=1 Tax=Haliotis rufescens TaxID=6454 RepID=UPI00201ED8DB|nr:N-sulphoglucosamine sulphohydrolase-like [Haliotis rufescens]